MTESTERLISGLVEELEPVARLPRLRSAFTVILALWAALLGVVLWSNAGTTGAGSLFDNRIYLASFAGLVVASAGGLASALAAGIPGRERIELLGMWIALSGLAAAAVACLIGVVALDIQVGPEPAGASGMCFREGMLFSLLPAGVIFGFMVRGWTAHPIRAAAIALVSSGALGVSVVHLSCTLMRPMHLLMGHLSVPLVLALLGLYPMGVILRRMRL